MIAFIFNQCSKIGKTRLPQSICRSPRNHGSKSSFCTTSTSSTIISKNNKCQTYTRTYRYRISPSISNIHFQNSPKERKVSHQYRNIHGKGVVGELQDENIQKNEEAEEESMTLLEKFQKHQKDEYLTVSILGPSNAGKSTLFNRLMCKESNKAYRLSSEKSARRPNRSKVGYFVYLFHLRICIGKLILILECTQLIKGSFG